MHLFIFEGIASSGKSTLERLLAERFPGAKIVTEGETLMPLIDNRDPDVARKHLAGLLERFRSASSEVLIVDRFHLTHAFRTKSALADFAEIEAELQRIGGVHLVLLTIDPAQIRARIEETVLRRGDAWKKGAQGSLDEKAAYYADQQERLKGFLRETALPSIEIDTTGKDWEAYAERLSGIMSP